MAKRLVRMGIVGCGRIVEGGHAPALKELAHRVQVVALCDPSVERQSAVGQILGVEPEHRYGDYHTMLDRESLDYVDLALPHFLHCPIAVDMAKAGVNIISEKPLATSLDEADRILEACAASGSKLGVLHNYRYGAVSQEAIRLVRRGTLGDVFLTRWESLSGGHWPGTASYDPAWRTKRTRGGGGCLIDNGYHPLYLARELNGTPVVSVHATIDTYYQPIDVDDTALVTLRHENKGTTFLMVGWCCQGGGGRVSEVHGRKGSLAVQRGKDALAHYDNRKGEWKPVTVPTESNAFARTIEDILDRHQAGKPAFSDGQEARRNLEVVTAAYRSAHTGRVIEVHVPAPGS